MMEKRLIDANALPNYKCQVTATIGDQKGPAEMRFVFWKDIDNAPTISAVPVVHGRWDKPVEHGLPYAANHLGVVCSYCCKWSDNDYNYCPNCGAKMDAEDMDVPTKDEEE